MKLEGWQQAQGAHGSQPHRIDRKAEGPLRFMAQRPCRLTGFWGPAGVIVASLKIGPVENLFCAVPIAAVYGVMFPLLLPGQVLEITVNADYLWIAVWWPS